MAPMCPAARFSWPWPRWPPPMWTVMAATAAGMDKEKEKGREKAWAMAVAGEDVAEDAAGKVA